MAARWCGLLAVVVSGALGCVCVPAAVAERGHLFSGTFGEPCSGSPCGKGQFSGPVGIAVSEATGDVYVVDKGDGRVEVFSAAGAFLGQFNGSGSYEFGGEEKTGAPAPDGAFSSPEEIAVDNSCVLHNPVLTEATKPSCAEYDPSFGDVYVDDAGHQVIDKFSGTGELIDSFTGLPEGQSFTALDGVAVDETGKVWVDGQAGGWVAADLNNQVSNEVEPEGTRRLQESLIEFSGLAVDRGDDIYGREGKSREESAIEKFNAAGDVLIRELDEEDSTDVAVDLVSNDVFVDNVSSVGVFTGSGRLLERFGSGLLTSSEGVGVSGVAETVYVSDASADRVVVFGPQAPGAPSVSEELVSQVTGDSVVLSGEVNPQGAATVAEVQFGRCAALVACAGAGFPESLPVGGEAVGSGFEERVVSVQPQGLVAGSAYHFRVVARSALGTTVGEEVTFDTQPAFGGHEALVDGGEWELVSPSEKHGAIIETIGTNKIVQAAGDGDAFTFVADAPVGGAPAGNGGRSQVFSARGGGTSPWESHSLSIGHETPTAGDGLLPYEAFSEDLSTALFQPSGLFVGASSPFALAPSEASEQTPFIRQIYGDGEPADFCVQSPEHSCFHPLVTGLAGFSDVPPGTVFAPCTTSTLFCGPMFAGASANLQHVVVASKVALTQKPLPPGGQGGLYESSEGGLSLVSELPDGQAASEPSIGGGVGDVVRDAVSGDGSRVVWSENGPSPHLYLRDVPAHKTLQLDVVQPGAEGTGKVEPAFQVASVDDSLVFFTDHQRLTVGSGAGKEPAEADLFVCEVVEGVSGLECGLRDITPAVGGKPAEVLGEVPGASEDGSVVYFVANGALAPGAVQGDCGASGSLTRNGLCNLYVARLVGVEWRVSLVAVLSQEDFPDWNGDEGSLLLEDMPVRVSGNGEWFVFMTDRDLGGFGGWRGYDPVDAVSGQPDEEVYLYNAVSGRLVCASCNPSGERPVGVKFDKVKAGLDGGNVWPEGQGVAASVPSWTTFSLVGRAEYQSRFLSDGGRLFFNSEDALVPGDVNGVGDVYEFEPVGVGGCSEGAKTFSERDNGCVGLISSGTSTEESGFLDASVSGADVFFLTASKLSLRDFDTSYDVYDAHVCTAAEVCFENTGAQRPVCEDTVQCRSGTEPVVEPEVFGAPASATFSGGASVSGVVGSPASTPAPPKRLSRAQLLAAALRVCRRKHDRGRRVACERSARARYGPVAHKSKAKGKARKSSVAGREAGRGVVGVGRGR